MTDPKTLALVGGVLMLLASVTTVVQVLQRRPDSGLDTGLLETFGRRVRSWWLLCAVLAAAFYIGSTATVVLFAIISFWALREFITLTPTRPSDHRALFWVFFLFTPLQYVAVGMKWYGLYTILIPVYASLIIPARIALSGDSKRFLERIAKIQAGLMVCVYCLSHAPALLTLNLSQGSAEADGSANARLLFFFVFMVQLGDALHYAWAQLPSKHVIAPTIHPGKTWEGLLGSTASLALIGAVLSWVATPFSPWMAALMSAVIALMGFGGAMTMSAIKRDRGVTDYGTLVAGHSGLLDVFDSICFAAPVFFHLTRTIIGR
jgi:phosphatidate cytidylyltransferase